MTFLLSRRVRWEFLLAAALAFAAAAAAAPVRSSIYAQVTGDEPEYLLTALSLAEDASLDVSDEVEQERYRLFHEARLRPQGRILAGDRMVSPHDPLLPALLAPAVAAGGFLPARLTLAVLAGLLAWLMAWFGVRRLGIGAGTSALAAGIFGASAPLAVYGSQVYPEIPAALALLGALAAATGDLRKGGMTDLVLGVVALCWLGTKFVPVAAVAALLGLFRLWSAGRPRAALAVTAAFAGAGLFYVAAHLRWYGALTVYAVGEHFTSTGQFSVVGVSPDYLSRTTRLIGLIVDGRFGLAAWQPAWLLMIPAVGYLVARRPPHWIALAAPLTVGWLTATFLALTMHGFWFPGRQVVVVLPLAVLAIAGWADGTQSRLAALLALGAAGLANLAWLLWEGHTAGMTLAVHFQDTTSPVYRTISQVLPHYMASSARSWALHGAWTLAALAAIVWAARSARAS